MTFPRASNSAEKISFWERVLQKELLKITSSYHPGFYIFKGRRRNTIQEKSPTLSRSFPEVRWGEVGENLHFTFSAPRQRWISGMHP
jgi:hypothetical protein